MILSEWCNGVAIGEFSQRCTNSEIRFAGEDVTVEDEVVVIKCIVLPHKHLNASVLEEIIL